MHRLGIVCGLPLALLGCLASYDAEGSADDEPHTGGADALEDMLAAQETPRTEHERILRILEGYGYQADLDDVEVFGDHVRVGGDVIFERDALLAGAYDERFARAPEDEGGFVEKGYTLGSVDDPSQIFLAVYSMPQNMVSIVDYTAWVWAAASDYTVGLTRSWGSTPLTGWVSIVTVDENDWDQTNCREESQACVSHFPTGYANSIIWIRSKPSIFLDCDWTPQFLAAVLLHELGHTLAMTHPGDDAASVIPNTCSLESCPNYDTVMDSTRYNGNCELVDPGDIFVYSDDIASIQALYAL